MRAVKRPNSTPSGVPPSRAPARIRRRAWRHDLDADPCRVEPTAGVCYGAMPGCPGFRAKEGAWLSSLLIWRSRARNEANLRLTPPCSRELAGLRRRRPRRQSGRRRGGPRSRRRAGASGPSGRRPGRRQIRASVLAEILQTSAPKQEPAVKRWEAFAPGEQRNEIAAASDSRSHFIPRRVSRASGRVPSYARISSISRRRHGHEASNRPPRRACRALQGRTPVATTCAR